jgi:hypothetical protein
MKRLSWPDPLKLDASDESDDMAFWRGLAWAVLISVSIGLLGLEGRPKSH